MDYGAKRVERLFEWPMLVTALLVVPVMVMLAVVRDGGARLRSPMDAEDTHLGQRF